MAVMGVPVRGLCSGRRGLGPGVVGATRTSPRRGRGRPRGADEGVEQASELGHGQGDELLASGCRGPLSVEGPPVQGRVKVSCRHLSCVDSAKDELQRGVNMAVLSGASNRQVTPTWAEGRC